MKTHVLVHLCVMNNMPLGEVSRYLPMPRRMPEYREGRTHENFLVNLGVSASIFLQSVSANWVNSQQIQEIPLAVRQMADELANDRFRLNEWTERF